MLILDKVAPHKTIRIKQRTEPWMTLQILEKNRYKGPLTLKQKDIMFGKTQFKIR